MSLVAYNASDESDSSSAEDENDAQTAKLLPLELNSKTEIRDEDDEYVSSTKPVLGTIDPTDTNNLEAREDVDSGQNTTTNFLKELPSPRHVEGITEKEGELEEEVRPKFSQISDAPKPPPKRSKQPVKISIPALKSDSDEEEEPVKKKPKPASSEKCQLFSLLPAPVHAAKKECNRLLIPHTLTKKKAKPEQDSLKPTASMKQNMSQSLKTEMPSSSRRYTPFHGLTGYDSDSEEEESSNVDFFSLVSTANPTPQVDDPVSCDRLTDLPSVVESSTETVTSTAESSTETDDSLTFKPQEIVNPDVPLTFAHSVTSDPDAPLNFRNSTAVSQPRTYMSNASLGALGLYGRSEVGSTGAYSQYFGNEDDDQVQQANQEEISQYMQDEQFLRLQGKKQRGKEEINIIDANMDDFVGSVEVTKGLTEESEYHSHRKKDNNPTQKQRKKHQITYLAFQAKERELELKNSWAQNKLTKRQTQAKYGF